MIPVTPKIGKSMGQAVDRHNGKLNEPNRLYDQVIEAFEMRNQWPSGHSERILDGWLRGKRSIFGLKNIDGWIVATLTVCGRTVYNAQFTLALYDPARGWSLASNATLANFNIWQRRTTREINRLENSGRL